MSTPRPETRVRVGSKVALGLAVLATVALSGAIAGPPGLVAGVVAGLAAVGVGAALRALVREDNRSRALGSVGVALCGAAVVAAVAGLLAAAGRPADTLLGHPMTDAGDALLLGLVTAGVLAAATDAFVESPAAATTEAVTTLWRSVHVLLVGALLAYLAAVGLLTELPLTVVGAATDALAAAGDPTPPGNTALVGSLVGLQLLALVVVWAVRGAVPVLDEWVASAAAGRGETDGDTDTGVTDLLAVLPDPVALPATVWGLLGVQVFLAVFLPRSVGELFGTVLEALGPLGGAVRVVLSTGLFHWPLAVVGLLAVAVLAGDGLRRAFVLWAGRNPPTTLAFAAGGVAGVTLGVALGVLVAGAEVVLGADAGVALGADSGGLVAPVVPVVVGVGMFGVLALALLPGRVAGVLGVDRASGFAGGAAALFVGGLWVALFGLSGGQRQSGLLRLLVPVAAVTGVAVSVLVWDLGENAVALRDQLGRDTDTRDVELTHGVASVLVAGGAVVVATLAYYLAGPLLFTPVELGPLSLEGSLVSLGQTRQEIQRRALVALGLTVVALLAFGFLVDRGQDPGPK